MNHTKTDISGYPRLSSHLLPRYRNNLSADLFRGRKKGYWPDGGVESDLFNARFPDTRLLIHMAKLAAGRRIQFWHPWHMEQTHRSYRLQKSIDWFIAPNGDHEWIESLVRFNHMIDLAAAYGFTNKQKYLRSFEEYLFSFSRCRKQPGRHWKYRLNPAIRIINLIRAYDLIARTDLLSLQAHLAVYENIIEDIEFLAQSLGKTVGNGEFFITTSLLIASEYLKDFFETGHWQQQAEERLLQILDSELQADGIEVEQAPMYHGEVLLTLLDYCVIQRTNALPIQEPLAKSISVMLDAVVDLADPCGRIPPIGDSDRFEVSYLEHFYRAVFEPPVDDRSQREKNSTPSSGTTRQCRMTLFRETGWVIVRWNYPDGIEAYLLFDCSGKPRPLRGNHSHADDLQFLLHTSNGPVLTDPGRFTYCREFEAYIPFTRRRIHPDGKFGPIYSLLFPRFIELKSRDWRRYFQQTLSHNTISQDGRNQPGYDRKNGAGSRTTLLDHRSVGPMVFLEGHLDTGSSSDDPEQSPAARTGHDYRHRRTFVGYLPHLWIIVDQIDSDSAHEWFSSYHLGEQVEIATPKEGQGGDPGSSAITMKAGVETHDLRFSGSKNMNLDLTIEQDWVSPVYNEKHPSRTVRVKFGGIAEGTLISVICSASDNETMITRSEAIETVPDGNGTPHDIFYIQLISGEKISHLIVNPQGKAIRYGRMTTDAFFALETRIGEKRLEAGFLGGSHLRIGDLELTASHPHGDAYTMVD